MTKSYIDIKYNIIKSLLFAGNSGLYKQEIIEVSGCKESMFAQYMTKLRKTWDIRRVKDKYFLDGIAR